MVLVLIIGGGLGWVIHRARVQREAVAVIERAGGSVGYGSEPPGSTITSWTNNPAADWVRQRLGRDFIDTVTYVFLRGKRCDDQALQAACHLPWLEELWVENTSATDLAAEDLWHLQNLKVLDLKLNQITGRALRRIGGMSELRELRLAMRLSPIPLRDEDMSFLKHMTKLERLQLPSDELTDNWLVYIKDLKNLTSLELYGMAVTSDGLRQLNGLTNLTVLNLHGTRVTGFSAICSLSKVASLGLAYTPAADPALDSLRGWLALSSLDLRNTHITDAGLAALRDLSVLQTIDLYGTRITDAGLKHLATLKSLRSVRVSETGATDEGVAVFSRMNPAVKVTR